MKNSSNLVFVILLLAVLGCSCPKLEEFTKQANTSGSPTASPTTAPFGSNSSTTSSNSASSPSSNSTLTLEKYNQIQTKMDRADVEKMLGGKGSEVSSSSGGGHTFTVVKWEGANFKTIILTFDNDKVMSKSQYGLS